MKTWFLFVIFVFGYVLLETQNIQLQSRISAQQKAIGDLTDSLGKLVNTVKAGK